MKKKKKNAFLNTKTCPNIFLRKHNPIFEPKPEAIKHCCGLWCFFLN